MGTSKPDRRQGAARMSQSGHPFFNKTGKGRGFIKKINTHVSDLGAPGWARNPSPEFLSGASPSFLLLVHCPENETCRGPWLPYRGGPPHGCPTHPGRNGVRIIPHPVYLPRN